MPFILSISNLYIVAGRLWSLQLLLNSLNIYILRACLFIRNLVILYLHLFIWAYLTFRFLFRFITTAFTLEHLWLFYKLFSIGTGTFAHFCAYLSLKRFLLFLANWNLLVKKYVCFCTFSQLCSYIFQVLELKSIEAKRLEVWSLLFRRTICSFSGYKLQATLNSGVNRDIWKQWDLDVACFKASSVKEA